MKKTVIVCGLIAGLVVSTIMAFSMASVAKNPEAMMSDGSMIIGYLSMLISFSLVFVGIKMIRDKHNGGYIKFGKAFLAGLYISLIASTIYVIAWAIIYHFFIPDFMDIYTECVLKKSATTSTPAQLQQKTAEMAQYKEMYKNPLFFTLLSFAEILPVGLLVTLISSLILKRKRKENALPLQ